MCATDTEKSELQLNFVPEAPLPSPSRTETSVLGKSQRVRAELGHWPWEGLGARGVGLGALERVVLGVWGTGGRAVESFW